MLATLNKESLMKYLQGFFRENSQADKYIAMHMDRFIRTLELFPVLSAGEKMLELGAYPYLSLLIKKCYHYEQYLNCLFDESAATKELKIENQDRSEIHSFTFYNFDVEKDTFPFDDSHFGLVCAFELIEHMKYDPMFMLCEANRVLKTGGKLFLSTPNVTSYRSIHFLINGFAPFYYPKFSYPIGASRHYREFSPTEIQVMLENAGFEVELLTTENVWQKTPEGFDYGDIYQEYEAFLGNYGIGNDLRGEDILAIAVKTGPVRERFPDQVYQR